METQGMSEGILIQERYKLTRKLGAGGMGEVWEAHHALLPNNRFAIKFLYAHGQESEQFERFTREAKILATLNHLNITRIHDYQLAHNPPYIVLEYLEGEPLSDRIQRARNKGERGLPLREVNHIMSQVRDALAITHREGVIHRDLKPENIYLCRIPDEAEPLVKVLDFGVSKMSGEQKITLHQQGFLGTPQYMSPEQALGNENVDSRADQFSLAIILYEMLSGELPFKGEQIVQIATQIVHGDPPYIRELIPYLPDQAAQALHRALCKSPEDRYVSCESFIDTFISKSLQEQDDDEWALDSQTEVGVRHSLMNGLSPIETPSIDQDYELDPKTIKMSFQPELYANSEHMEHEEGQSNQLNYQIRPPSIKLQPQETTDPTLFPQVHVMPSHYEPQRKNTHKKKSRIGMITLIIVAILGGVISVRGGAPTLDERATYLNQTPQIKGSLILPEFKQWIRGISLVEKLTKKQRRKVKLTQRLPPHQRVLKLGQALFLLYLSKGLTSQNFSQTLELHWFGPNRMHFTQKLSSLSKDLHPNRVLQSKRRFDRTSVGRWVALLVSNGEVVAELPFEVRP
jgi:serine/threonine protein kinase